MKFLKNCRPLIAGLSLLAGASAVQALDTETGLVKLGIASSGSYDNDVVSVEMAAPLLLGTGRCTSMFLVLEGEGNKAVYTALLAANIAAKAVTIEYLLNEDDSCSLIWAHLN